MNTLSMARKIRLIMKLRKAGITDTAVLSAIETVKREAFILPLFHDQAYEDITLPIGEGQTISRPSVVATMTQALKLHDRHKVLEIGTGSGYQAAILSKLCRRVYSIERHKPLSKAAEEKFLALDLRNITCKVADGMNGWHEQAPFDRIIVTAAACAEAPPKPLLDQLSIGGVLIIPMGRDLSNQYVYTIIKLEEDNFECERLMPVRFVPLLPNTGEEEQQQMPVMRDNNYRRIKSGANAVKEFAY